MRTQAALLVVSEIPVIFPRGCPVAWVLVNHAAVAAAQADPRGGALVAVGAVRVAVVGSGVEGRAGGHRLGNVIPDAPNLINIIMMKISIVL